MLSNPEEELSLQSIHSSSISFKDILVTFFILGATSFGAGAIIGLIQDKLVNKYKWLSYEEAVEAVAVGQSLPGAISTNVVTYAGYRIKGLLGAVLALLGYIFPSFCMMVVLTILYQKVHRIPVIEKLFFGLNPAVAGLILGTATKFIKELAKNEWQVLQIVIVFLVAINFPQITLYAILLSGLYGIVGIYTLRYISIYKNKKTSIFIQLRPILFKIASVIIVSCTAVVFYFKLSTWYKNLELLYFSSEWLSTHKFVGLAYLALKLGACTFGGGYVIVPLMEPDIVSRFKWMSHHEFIDGMILGQITPGPFIITIAFVGYLTGGIAGSLIATIGVFIIPFFLTVWAGHSLERFRENLFIQGLLTGIMPTSIALLAVAAKNLVHVSLVSSVGQSLVLISLFIISYFLSLQNFFKPYYILIISAVVGWIFCSK